MKINAKKWVGRLLLSFVLLSIGYALGKEATLRRLAEPADASSVDESTASEQTQKAEQVTVYYFHPSIRCATCVKIEKMARAAVTEEFPEAIEAGRLIWRDVDFEDNEALARQFDVGSSSVIVVRQARGEMQFEKLERIWTLVGKQEEFRRYVADAVREALGEEGP